jgi:hypothetical protein
MQDGSLRGDLNPKLLVLTLEHGMFGLMQRLLMRRNIFNADSLEEDVSILERFIDTLMAAVVS